MSVIDKPKPVLVSVDGEMDGPWPGGRSLIALGAVVIEPGLQRRFLGYLRPISDKWEPEALAISGFTREQTEGFPEAIITMVEFLGWLETLGRRPVFVADNAGDWMFVSWYLWTFTGRNPFGHSMRNINDLWKGIKQNWYHKGWKKLRVTSHDHNPLNDALGNAEAVLKMIEAYPKMFPSWARL